MSSAQNVLATLLKQANASNVEESSSESNADAASTVTAKGSGIGRKQAGGRGKEASISVLCRTPEQVGRLRVVECDVRLCVQQSCVM